VVNATLLQAKGSLEATPSLPMGITIGISDAISYNDLWIETMDLNKLNKLKKGIPEAFGDWHEISKIYA